jgi:Raf kinase inhibitor-like YbhB/YbcL family protein
MMILKSSAFKENQPIPPQYAKAGQNISPPLSWENAPEGTKAFALAIVDHHPVARNFVHWMVIDIPASVTSLAEGASATPSMPNGARELKPYTGPNPPPPSGSHDYEFTLYALKTSTLDLPEKVPLEQFINTVQQNTLATATLIGKYDKNKVAQR